MGCFQIYSKACNEKRVFNLKNQSKSPAPLKTKTHDKQFSNTLYLFSNKQKIGNFKKKLYNKNQIKIT